MPSAFWRAVALGVPLPPHVPGVLGRPAGTGAAPSPRVWACPGPRGSVRGTAGRYRWVFTSGFPSGPPRRAERRHREGGAVLPPRRLVGAALPRHVPGARTGCTMVVVAAAAAAGPGGGGGSSSG